MTLKTGVNRCVMSLLYHLIHLLVHCSKVSSSDRNRILEAVFAPMNTLVPIRNVFDELSSPWEDDWKSKLTPILTVNWRVVNAR